MTKFKDVAHLYLGCAVVTKFRKATSQGEPLEKMTGRLMCVDLFYEDSVGVLMDEEEDKTHQLQLKENEFKPILRKLSDMIQEEKVAVGFTAHQVLRSKMNNEKYSGFMWAAQQTLYLTSRHFDLFGLIDNGFAIDDKDIMK